MLRNYFKTAFRSLIRNRNYSIINIAGLAVGIAVFRMIFIIIQFHSSYDDFHKNKDRIYRVLTEYHPADAATISYGKDVPIPMPKGSKPAFPQIEQVPPIWASHNDPLLIPNDNGTTTKTIKEDKGVFFTEPSFFKMFEYALLAGSYKPLKDPNNVLLTKEIAEKYFGDWKTAIGKTIKLQAGGYIFGRSTDILKVTGIFATIPANTDFQLKLVVAFETRDAGYMAKITDWKDRTNADFRRFILLPPNSSVDKFNQQLRAYSAKVKSPGNKDSHVLQPLTAVHYDTQTGNYSTCQHPMV